MERKLSYASSPSKSPYEYKTLTEMLKYWADRYPHKDAYIEYSKDGHRKTLTWSKLLSKADTFGKYLVKEGVGKGDVVVFCMNNSLNMLIAMFGVFACGGITVIASNYMEDGSDVIEMLQDTHAKALVIDDNFIEVIRKVIALRSATPVQLHANVVVYNGTNVDAEIAPHGLLVSLQGAIENCGETSTSLPTVFPEDHVMYIKTSGSTGKPKLVSYSHMSLLAYARGFDNGPFQIDHMSVYFCDRHFGWMVGSPTELLASGCTRILTPVGSANAAKNIDIVSNIIEAEEVTHAFFPSYLLADLLNRPDLKDKYVSMKSLISGSERIPGRYSYLIDRFCKNLTIRFGLTELCGVSCFRSDSPEDYEDGIIGQPQPGTEMKLVNGNGDVVLKGEQGELYTRSMARMSSFVGMPEKFHEVIDSDNWFHTGDICHIRQDGNFVVDGRTSERIDMATKKILPKEIESVISKCPGVTAVTAVPIPDVRLTNVICACVILDETSGVDLCHVKEFCNNTWVESNAISGLSLRPTYYLVFDRFLTNANGKLDRKNMAEKARHLLGL